MPREKELFRDNLERIDNYFPSRELLRKGEVVEYTGMSYKKVVKTFTFKGNYISKVVLARELC